MSQPIRLILVVFGIVSIKLSTNKIAYLASVIYDVVVDNAMLAPPGSLTPRGIVLRSRRSRHSPSSISRESAELVSQLWTLEMVLVVVMPKMLL